MFAGGDERQREASVSENLMDGKERLCVFTPKNNLLANPH